MKLWAWDKKNLPSIMHIIHTAVAATASVIIARLVQMPEAYWAAIATLVVMQGTLGATLTLSIDRIVATAVGALIGALEINYFGANLVAFGFAIILRVTDWLEAPFCFVTTFRLLPVPVVPLLFVGELDKVRGELTPISPGNHVQSPA
jgi:hypothetical protein